MQLPPDAPIIGASRALHAAAIPLDDETARWFVFDRALGAALAEPRTPWTLDVLADLAQHHLPALAPALAIARDRPQPTTPHDSVLARSCIDALARLASAAGEPALLDEAVVAAHASGRAAFDLPYLIARASPGIGPVAPEAVLAQVATLEPMYRALAHALVARDLPALHRRRAIDATLAAPALGNAQPFVAIAEHLDADQYPRALDLASALYSSPSFGATAVRVLVPGWAALGHVDDALVRARAIRDEPEQRLALALIAPHVGDRRARDQLVREATHYMSGSELALVAAALVPIGYADQLYATRNGNSPAAVAGLAAASSGAARAALVAELGTSTCVDLLHPFARELVPELVFPTWLAELGRASGAWDPDGFFEDECAWGLAQWMTFVPLLGGAEGTRQVAEAAMP